MKSIIDECNISEGTFALEEYLKAGSLEDQASVDVALTQRAESQQADHTTLARDDANGRDSSTTNADPIRSILEGSGIAYSHDHAALVGDSAAEAALYRDAAQLGRRLLVPRRRSAPSRPLRVVGISDSAKRI